MVKRSSFTTFSRVRRDIAIPLQPNLTGGPKLNGFVAMEDTVTPQHVYEF